MWGTKSLSYYGEQASMIHLILGKEKQVGRDFGNMEPRCLMAAKFRTPQDPSGEIMLKHWIAIGQLQDSLSFRIATQTKI